MQEFDKSEAATPFKLQQARDRGSVARSPDLTGAVAMLTAAATMCAWGWEAVQALAALARAASSMAWACTCPRFPWCR